MILNNFDDSERLLLVSMPYRIGMWISRIDDIGGSTRDDRQEKQVLHLAIEQLARRHKSMPFAAEIMLAVDKARGEWPRWDLQASEREVLAGVQEALAFCHIRAGARALKEYKYAIWQIAMVVAQAYDEQNDPDNEMHIDRMFEWAGSFFRKPKLLKRPDNISPAEKTALKKLQAVLKA